MPHTVHLSNVTSLPHTVYLSNETSMPHTLHLSNETSMPHTVHLSNEMSMPHTVHLSSRTCLCQIRCTYPMERICRIWLYLTNGTSMSHGAPLQRNVYATTVHLSSGTSMPPTMHLSSGTSIPCTVHLPDGTSIPHTVHLSNGTCTTLCPRENLNLRIYCTMYSKSLKIYFYFLNISKVN